MLRGGKWCRFWAISNNNDKILNIIVQYYDTESSRVVIDHLGSRKQNLATAANILQSIEHVLEEYEIQWTQIASVLMDNCSTMRGVRGGVETLMREKNHNLMDISGDTVHMVNNVAKTLLSHVDSAIQEFCSDIYYDVEESPKVREIFHEVQGLLNHEKAKQLIRPISSRFLQMLDVCDRVVDLMDSLTVYYFSFLTDKEKDTHRYVMNLCSWCCCVIFGFYSPSTHLRYGSRNFSWPNIQEIVLNVWVKGQFQVACTPSGLAANQVTTPGACSLGSRVVWA